MDKLWAPWRSKYIYLRNHPKCIFCSKQKGRPDKKTYLLERSKHSFSLLNLYPYNNGHVMVAPFRHVKSLDALTKNELADMMELVRKTVKTIDKKLKPHGYNIGINIGKVAGAGFAGHIHVHIVPRWTGDTNFMPITANTKIVSDSLLTMQRLLKSKA